MQGLLRQGLPVPRPLSHGQGRQLQGVDRASVAVSARASSPVRTASGKAASTSKPSTVASRSSRSTQSSRTSKAGTGSEIVQQPTRSKSPDPDKQPGQFYFNFTGFPFPLGPFFTRRTVRCEASASYAKTIIPQDGTEAFGEPGASSPLATHNTAIGYPIIVFRAPLGCCIHGWVCI